MGPHFSTRTIRFLRSLKRNNDREWFKARKDQFDACVREPMIDVVKHAFIDQISVHHGHTRIIEITSDTTATGVWAMEDRLYRGKNNPNGPGFVLGFGHYHETYVKLAKGWRLKTTLLTRLYVEMRNVL